MKLLPLVGLPTGLATGTTAVTATYQGKSGSLPVVVSSTR